MGWAGLGLNGPWGVLGGTFDPIHYAHLAMAEQTRETLGLSGVMFVPVGVPPHKQDQRISAAHHRVAMVELAIKDNAAFRLSRTEVDRPGPSYTSDTLRLIAQGLAQDGDTSDSAGDAEVAQGLVIIVSMEALRAFGTWHEPQSILRQARVAVVPRLGFPLPDAEDRALLARLFPSHTERFIFLAEPLLGISASAIRARAIAGRSVRYLVPDDVARYIEDHRLYQPSGATESEGDE